jgi:hypothetical protein
MSELQKPEEYQPKPLSLRQNIILTAKVLAGAAVLLGLIWLGNTLSTS